MDRHQCTYRHGWSVHWLLGTHGNHNQLRLRGLAGGRGSRERDGDGGRILLFGDVLLCSSLLVQSPSAHKKKDQLQQWDGTYF
jgi:hypothetical protein